MRYQRLTLAICITLLISAATPVWAKDTWVSVRSKNFFLVGNASEKEIRAVAVKLEQFREVFSRLFTSVKMNSAVPTTVIVFKSDKSYAPFKHGNAVGYFQAGSDVNYITLTTDVRGEQDPFSVIFHEYTHLLVNNTIGNAPAWLNEGLAEYYSTFSITDDRKIVLGNPIGNHVFHLRESKMLPLKTLFKVDHQSPYYNERDKQSIFYAQSWALVHYLILGNNGQRLPQIDKFIQLGEANLALEEAFQQAFQIPLEKMEKELREYIKRDRYPVVSGHFERKLNFDTEMQAAPLTEAEAQAYLGDLLLHTNRTDGDIYLQRALTLDPNLAMAHASLGMLHVRQGKLDLARGSLERAVALNSQNYLIHYYYAFALSREGMSDRQPVTAYAPETIAQIREELKKAISLRPDYPESYSLLAFVNLVSGTGIDESIQLLKNVLKTSPGRNDLQFMLAQLYLGKQDYKAARELSERLSKNSSDAGVRQRAQTLLTQLVDREEALARFEAERRNATASQPRLTTSSPTTVSQAPVDTPVDPSSYLREALRKPEDGQIQVQATLQRIDCDAKGITVVIQVGDRLLKLRTDHFDNVEIVAFTNDAGSELTCGPRKAAASVIVCYLPSTNAGNKVDGIVKSIDFVPKDFQLKPQP